MSEICEFSTWETNGTSFLMEDCRSSEKKAQLDQWLYDTQHEEIWKSYSVDDLSSASSLIHLMIDKFSEEEQEFENEISILKALSLSFENAYFDCVN